MHGHHEMKKKNEGPKRAKKKRDRDAEKERWKQDAQRREAGDTPGQSPLPGRGQTADKSPGTS